MYYARTESKPRADYCPNTIDSLLTLYHRSQEHRFAAPRSGNKATLALGHRGFLWDALRSMIDRLVRSQHFDHRKAVRSLVVGYSVIDSPTFGLLGFRCVVISFCDLSRLLVVIQETLRRFSVDQP
jgi:hypothetical protein